MAQIYRFPICFWQNGKNAVTARLVDDGYDDVSVTANSKKEAVAQLKEYLQHLAKTDSWKLFEPDFEDAQLRVLKFSVLPEYSTSRRRYPCRESFPFRMPCIIGKRLRGSPLAYLPALNEFFDYHREENFEKLAIHIAQRELSRKTPAQLSRFTSPREVELDQLSITLKEPPSKGRRERNLQPLSLVADHLASASFRAQARTWERESEVDQVFQLLREEKNSLCLMGPSGCGKTSVLIEAARRLEREFKSQDKSAGEKRRYWMTSGARLIAGMRWLGQWEERLEEVVRQLGNLDGVLCIESLSELTRLGGDGPESSLAAFLQPYLQHGELRIIVEATPEELSACERILPGLVDQLQIVRLDSFTDEQAARVLHRAAEAHTRNDGIEITASAAARTHSLFKRFQPYVAFPGKVIHFLQSVVDESLTLSTPASDLTIGPKEVEDHFSKHSGLPSSLTHAEEAFDHEELTAFLQSQVLSQKESVAASSRVVAKFAAGLNDPQRPISVMLFCGPTGVGKTQLVRALGEKLFQKRPVKERIIRLDMSEYSGPDAATRLLGESWGEPSDLVKRVRAHPFSILLLDEIEKANEEVFDLFLNVFEEGRLTDPLGRVTSFQSCLIVMTSNLGAGSSGSIGFDSSGGSDSTSTSQMDRQAVLQFFRPEFFNRIDQVVYFQPLSRDTIESITRKELQSINQREGLEDRGIELQVSTTLMKRLAEKGFDPLYGARPLQRSIEETITLPLARWLTQQKKISNKSVIVAELESEGTPDEKVRFTRF